MKTQMTQTQENKTPVIETSQRDTRSQAQRDHEQQRLFERDHTASHFECGGTFNGFECGSDADSGL